MTQSSHDRSRTLAIGDIHGCNRALGALLKAVQATTADLVITLGDYSSRGLDSKGVLDRLLSLRQQCKLIAIRGNHEELMLAARGNRSDLNFWLTNGGEATLTSYAPRRTNRKLSDVPAEHWRFMEHDCVDYFETDTHIFVHGGVDPDLPMSRQSPRRLRWKRFDQAEPHCSGKIIICGHTPQDNHRPRNLGHSICLDTAAGYDGLVTCLDVHSGTLWSADERGNIRESTLPPPTKM